MAKFFETYLRCRITFESTEAYVLKSEAFDIVIEMTTDAQLKWPERFHIGFERSTLAEVTADYEKFKADGLNVETQIFNNAGRGSRFFCRGPEGLLFEILTREDADSGKWETSK